MLFLITLKTAAIKVGTAIKQCGILFLGYLYKATKKLRSRTSQLQGTAAESLVLEHNFLALRILNTEQTITQDFSVYVENCSNLLYFRWHKAGLKQNLKIYVV